MSISPPRPRIHSVRVPAGRSTAGRLAREERWSRAEALLDGVEGSSRREAKCRRDDAIVLTLDMADMVAGRYSGRGIDHEDLLQVARMALVKAVHAYRAGRGSSLAAFALPTVSGEVKRYFRDQGWAVRPPRRLQERRAELLQAREELGHQLRHEPSRVEIGDHLGWDRGEVSEVIGCCASYVARSLDAQPTVGFAALVEAGQAERLELSDALHVALADLTARERRIVALRFVEERTQSEIGSELGISQMQVSRLLAAIVGRLRTTMEVTAA